MLCNEKDYEKIKKTILYSKDSNLNTCEILIGNYKLNNTLFNKILDKSYFTKILNTFIEFKNKTYTNLIYNFNNHHLFINTKTKSKKSIIKKNFNNTLINNNLLLLSYNLEEQRVSDYSIKQNYNIVNESITEIIINEEIKLRFNDYNDTYKITLHILLNHNLDNTLILLKNIINKL